MRRKKTLSLSEVLKEYRSEMNIDNKLKEINLIKSWEEIAGKAIARRTSKVYIKDGSLYIHLNSSVARNELSMLRESLRERLNEKAGEELVKDIILR